MGRVSIVEKNDKNDVNKIEEGTEKNIAESKAAASDDEGRKSTTRRRRKTLIRSPENKLIETKASNFQKWAYMLFAMLFPHMVTMALVFVPLADIPADGTWNNDQLPYMFVSFVLLFVICLFQVFIVNIFSGDQKFWFNPTGAIIAFVVMYGTSQVLPFVFNVFPVFFLTWGVGTPMWSTGALITTFLFYRRKKKYIDTQGDHTLKNVLKLLSVSLAVSSSTFLMVTLLMVFVLYSDPSNQIYLGALLGVSALGLRLFFPWFFVDKINVPNHEHIRVYVSLSTELCVEAWIQMAFPHVSEAYVFVLIACVSIVSVLMGSLFFWRPYNQWILSGGNPENPESHSGLCRKLITACTGYSFHKADIKANSIEQLRSSKLDLAITAETQDKIFGNQMEIDKIVLDEKWICRTTTHFFIRLWAQCNASLIFISIYFGVLFSTNLEFYPFPHDKNIFYMNAAYSSGMAILQVFIGLIIVQISNRMYAGERPPIELTTYGYNFLADKKSALFCITSIWCIGPCAIFLFIKHADTVYGLYYA